MNGRAWVRTALLAALILAAGAGALPAADVPGAPHVKVHFAPKPAGDPDGIDAHIVAFFGRARKTLHGCFYEIRDQKFVDALIAAKQRGVDVRILLDNTTYFKHRGDGTVERSEHNAFALQLMKAKIPVRHDLHRSGLMHNKFAIADGRWVWTGSVNLTDTYARNCNNAIEIDSPAMARIYEREFDKKFEKQLFGAKAPSHASEQRVEVDGIPMETLFAPEDDPMSRILELLEKAERSIHFAQFAFTESAITKILLRKRQDGVEIRGIFDHRLYRSTGPYADFSQLMRAEVPVQLYAGPGLMHDKYFIVDAGSPGAAVITGSQNASKHGNNSNDENVLVVHSKEVSDLFLKDFERLWGESSQVGAEALYDADPVAGTVLPAVDVVITANGVRDIDRIRVEYPARWPLDRSLREQISVRRDGRDVTGDVALKFYEKGFFLERPGMTPVGPGSVLELRFRQMPVPEIAGVYNLYISVAQERAPEEFLPIRIQPTIAVRPASDGDARNNVLTQALRRSALGGETRQVADGAAGLDALLETLAHELEQGDLTSARALVEYLEGMDPRSGEAAGRRLRDVRRSLLAIPAGSAAHEEARELGGRLDALVR